MANDVMVQLVGDGEYRIRCGADFSEHAVLGEGLEWSAPNGKTYLAYVDVEGGADQGDGVESAFEHYVYEVRPVVEADIEEVEGEEGDEGDDGDDAGDDEGDEEDGGEEEVKE